MKDGERGNSRGRRKRRLGTAEERRGVEERDKKEMGRDRQIRRGSSGGNNGRIWKGRKLSARIGKEIKWEGKRREVIHP